MLAARVEVLNDANDKIITLSWSVIGIIAGVFAIAIGLNFWNNLNANRIRIEAAKNELKEDVAVQFNNQKGTIEKTIKNTVTTEVSSIRRELETLHKKVRDLDIDLLMKELKLLTGKYGWFPIDQWMTLLALNMEDEVELRMVGNHVGMYDTLKGMLDYVKEKTLDVDDKRRLLELLAKLDKRYGVHVEEINKHIKVR